MSINGYRLREPPELDIPREEPKTLGDLIALFMHDLGYSLGDFAKAMNAREDEFALTYAIELPGERSSKQTHLRRSPVTIASE
jgi:hypothetical protein